MKKLPLEKLLSRKFLVAVVAMIGVVASKEIGIDEKIVNLLVVLAVGYIGTEGVLDLAALFRAIYREKPEEAEKLEEQILPPGN